MRILILGGHGFLGKNLAKVLQNSSHEIVTLSRRNGLNLIDLESTKVYFSKISPDVIVNCAAHVGSLHYVTSFASDVLHDNVLMKLNIYKSTKIVCPRTRIINPLSNCSYPGESGIQNELDWWKGEVHESVFSYGNAKRFIYVTAYCYKKQDGIETCNFLVPNTFGPGDYTDPNKTHALNGMVIRMIQAHRQNSKEFEIWGTGNPVREWAYIDDVVEIIKQGMEIECDLIYPTNIAQRKGYSIKETAKIIAQEIGYKGELIFNSSYKDGAPQKILDDKKFRKLFPNFKFIDHQEGIRRTVNYYASVL
jgi:GDP-L-fucose synthase